ncbi:MAG: hypothetical protein SNJ82_06325, partial [Gemmataceae bacterium]
RGEKSLRLLTLRAKIYDSLGQRKKAQADRQEVLLSPSTDLPCGLCQATILLDYDPKAALAHYRSLERQYPRQPEPLMGQVYILGEILKQPKQALACLDRLLDDFPEDLDAICCRAIYLARLECDAQALREIQHALRLSNHPFTHYRVGCAYALLTQRTPRYKEAAIHHLMLALEHFHGLDILLNDPDLERVRGDLDFKVLVDFLRLFQRKLPTHDRF